MKYICMMFYKNDNYLRAMLYAEFVSVMCRQILFIKLALTSFMFTIISKHLLRKLLIKITI